LHPLLLEDILNTSQRPKAEDFGNHIFVTMKMLSINEAGDVKEEHMSFVLGSGYLLSFQEKESPLFSPIRDRILHGSGRTRAKDADYLLYLLIDLLVDNYFLLIDSLAGRIESLESEVSERPKREHLLGIQDVRSDLLSIRKSIIPLRELVNFFIRGQSSLINPNISPFFFDLSDHIFHLFELVENYREMALGLKDMYNSSVNMRMNQVMQTLTVVTTVFIPLSFLTGVYGMNFRNMPELGWRYGYFGLLGAMLSIALLMLLHFRRRGWI
jgi:magnesium transporter